MPKPILRFAPSPNGRLHLGHARSALLNREISDRLAGRLLLRIEDIDTARCTPEFEAGILRDLEWLGLHWETPVRRQSEHLAEYSKLLDRLTADDLVYPAFMSRGEVRAWIAEREARGERWPRDPDGVPHYPSADKALGARERRRRMAEGEPFAWRLDTERALEGQARDLAWTEFEDATLSATRQEAARPERWGDVMLARKDIPTSYHLSVVADDAVQGISHVVRGMDLFSATGIHRLLQELLGLPQPAYFHHPLILGPDGRKLSKSFHDTGIEALREAGSTPADIGMMVGL